MKKKLTLIILGLGLIGSIAYAAPTSTIVQNLFITGLKDSSIPCLNINSNGAVATTTCLSAASSTSLFVQKSLNGTDFASTSATGNTLLNNGNQFAIGSTTQGLPYQLTFFTTNASSGIALYNNNDLVNYERLTEGWAGNTFTITTENGGTGTLRNIIIRGNTATLKTPSTSFIVNDSPNTSGFFQLSRTTSSGGINHAVVSIGDNNSASVNAGLVINGTWNGSATAGFRGLWVEPNITGTGTGVHELARFDTSQSAGNGVTITESASSTGNVYLGIGTSTPSYSLDISSSTPVLQMTDTATSKKYQIRNGAAALNGWDLFDFSSSTSRIAVGANGFVGIGTTAPYSLLHALITRSNTFQTGIAPGLDTPLVLQNTNAANNNNVGIGFDTSGNSTINTTGGIGAYRTGSNGQGGLYFASKSSVSSGANMAVGMVLDQNQRIGIGTTTPASTLHVNGGFTLTSASSTIITPSIGGGALLAGACTSATSTVDSVISSTTTAFPTTPQNDPGDGFFWSTILQSTGVIKTKVCASVAGTPAATAYVVKIIQ